ncbi:hypothetical protein BX265_7019 [Streptomyces sp. TLI_235]|nr:hypothetical protein [Streptomyces sp. TLI_235]PBC69679.1 hypothetical protein BX265_7019 [Streptomyces sp. TLI_235]
MVEPVLERVPDLGELASWNITRYVVDAWVPPEYGMYDSGDGGGYYEKEAVSVLQAVCTDADGNVVIVVIGPEGGQETWLWEEECRVRQRNAFPRILRLPWTVRLPGERP